jgi:hypothetical protein
MRAKRRAPRRARRARAPRTTPAIAPPEGVEEVAGAGAGVELELEEVVVVVDEVGEVGVEDEDDVLVEEDVEVDEEEVLVAKSLA